MLQKYTAARIAQGLGTLEYHIFNRNEIKIYEAVNNSNDPIG